MANEIPLLTGKSHQNFSIDLGDSTLEFRFNWVTRFGYFRVDIFDLSNDRRAISLGETAHSGVNLLARHPEYGRVYMSGPVPSIENIGAAAKLIWEPANG